MGRASSPSSTFSCPRDLIEPDSQAEWGVNGLPGLDRVFALLEALVSPQPTVEVVALAVDLGLAGVHRRALQKIVFMNIQYIVLKNTRILWYIRDVQYSILIQHGFIR